tara:strand:- start:1200 stop:1469 length:270 start_codon:yes stop_codon:yes gene_type:complete
MSHSYTNPSEKLDLSHLEAQVTKGKKYYDEQGWEISPPISDRECILKCLENCEQLAGLDRKQVRKLIDEFSSGQMKEDVVELVSEYPPL